MNIADASDRSGLTSKTIRYYEQIGLVMPVRAQNGYRDYGMTEVHKLRFLQRARSLGFSVKECRQLMTLYEDKARASADVKALARHKQAEIDEKIAVLMQIRGALGHLIANCQGDDRPECPILDSLASGDGA